MSRRGASSERVEGNRRDHAWFGAASRVRAPADKGTANRAVAAVLSGWLSVANSSTISSIRVSTGAKSRVMTLEIFGEAARLVVLLAARLREFA